MKKYYCFAGLGFEIDVPDGMMYENERNLAPFAVESAENPHKFAFFPTDALSPPVGELIAAEPAVRVYGDGERRVRYIGSVADSWENAYCRVTHFKKEHTVELKRSTFPRTVGVNTVLSALSIEHLTAEIGGIVLHSSYVSCGGGAILFTAPSGTGKSTQADLWERFRGAETVNGDRSAVLVRDGEAIACGIPFSGSSQICKNVTLPVRAIVYLKQSPKTEIRRLKSSEAFRRVWEGCSVNVWDAEDVSRVSDTVIGIVESVPVYELSCTPDESAVLALEGVLSI